MSTRTVGAGGPNPTANYGRLFIALKPRKERDERGGRDPAPAREGDAGSGHADFFQSIQNINIGGRSRRASISTRCRSSDTEALYRVAPEMRDRIAKVPGLLDVTTDLYIKNPQLTVEIDREKAAVYGITVDQVRQELYNAFGTRQVATIYTPANDYQIILEAQPKFQVDPSDLSKIYLKTAEQARPFR